MATSKKQPEKWLEETTPKLRESLRGTFTKFFDEKAKEELAAKDAYTQLFPVVAECIRPFLESGGGPIEALVKLVAPPPYEPYADEPPDHILLSPA